MIKKVILFIVEGENDRKEIYSILKTPYFDGFRDKYRIEFLVTHGDITSVKGNNEKVIINEIGKKITSWIRSSIGVSHRDIERIVQVVDTDGAFIPNECIIDDGIFDFYYEKESLKTLDVNGAKNRNKRKSLSLIKMNNTNEICNIPYKVFYMSCNMDDVLFNNKNLSMEKKRSCQCWFVGECDRNPSVVFDSILSDSVICSMSYEESWRWIQVGTRSLKRHTNLDIFLLGNIDKEQ